MLFADIVHVSEVLHAMPQRRNATRDPDRERHMDWIRGFICTLLFTHFFVRYTEPESRQSLLDPPGGECPAPCLWSACVWSYVMTWVVSRLLCAIPWLSVHHPFCRCVTATATCVPIGLRVSVAGSACAALVIMWAPPLLLFCGKRGAQHLQAGEEGDDTGKRRIGGRPSKEPSAADMAKLVEHSLETAKRGAEDGTATYVHMSLTFVGTTMVQVGQQQRWEVNFEWALACGDTRITEQWKSRADKIPAAVPFPARFRTAQKALALKSIAAESETAAKSKLPSSTDVNLSCRYLGVPKPGCKLAGGTCEDALDAAAAFEPDPFLWPTVTGRNSHRQVAAIWSWGDGTAESHWVSFARLDNLLSCERHWEAPAAIYSECVERILRRKAGKESLDGKARCVFVRLDWLGDKNDAQHLKCEAVFAFEHVYQDATHNTPYYVSMRLDNALCDTRRVPRHPLRIPDDFDGFHSKRRQAVQTPKGAPRTVADVFASIRRFDHDMELQRRREKRELAARWTTARLQVNGQYEDLRYLKAIDQVVAAPRDCPGPLHFSVAFFDELAASLGGDQPSSRFKFVGTVDRELFGAYNRCVPSATSRTDEVWWGPCLVMRDGVPHWGRPSIGSRQDEVPSCPYSLDMNAYWQWPDGHSICIPARDLAAMSDADLAMLSNNTHPEWQTDQDLRKEHGALGGKFLAETRLSNKCRSDAIACNEELFERFGVPLSGILAVDEHILEQLDAMIDSETEQQHTEASPFSVLCSAANLIASSLLIA